MDTRNRDSPVVYICSRYSGNIERNTDLARRYSRLAVERGCVPLTPHLLLPQFLSEETEREKAISLDLRFLGLCQELWVCGPDVSEGMRREIDCAAEMKIPIRYIKEEEILCMQLPKA